MQIRLQLSVALAFVLLTVVVLGVAVTFFFVSNRALAIQTARNSMADAQARSDAALVADVAPVVRLVASTGRFLRNYSGEVGQPRAFDVLAGEIVELASVHSLFFAGAGHGDFMQVVRIAPGMERFGTGGFAVPAGAVQAHRLVTGPPGDRFERIAFVAADGSVAAEVTGPTEFNAASRPWYGPALVGEGTFVSPVYEFASSGLAGVTFSRRVQGDGGALIGVVGADMSLESISQLLTEVRVDGVGEVFLLSQAGQLLAASEVPGADGTMALTQATLSAWDGSDTAFFRVRKPGSNAWHLVSMARMTPIGGSHPVLGVIVPQQHFVGPIGETTRRVLALSAVVGLVAVAAVVLLSRLLSQPLQRVSEEAVRIGAFDLSADFRMNSHITEVAELGAAMGRMKNSLVSFGSYVPKEVVRSLVASGGQVAVGGTAREVTLMFSDIEGFTAKSEALPPEVAMRDLSRYFEAMAAAVAASGGTVDKYIGDAVMALWNAPAEVPGHAAAACRGALGCLAAEAALNAAGAGAIFPVRTRIGLHSDRVVVGNVGSTDRLQYTAIGGAVNLASRVEGLNKAYGTQVLATGAVVDAAGPGFVWREIDLVSPAGTTRPVALHTLVGEAGQVDAAVLRDLQAWAAALEAFRRCDWAGAAARFAALRGGPAGEVPVALYLRRCAAFARSPPADGWNGVTALTEK